MIQTINNNLRIHEFAYLGHRLKILRQAHGLTLADAGRKGNMHPQQVQKYEGGKGNIPLSRLEILAKLYKIEVTDLLNEKPDLFINVLNRIICEREIAITNSLNNVK